MGNKRRISPLTWASRWYRQRGVDTLVGDDLKNLFATVELVANLAETPTERRRLELCRSFVLRRMAQLWLVPDDCPREA